MSTKKLNLSQQLLKSILVIYFIITFVVTLIHFMIEYNYTKSHIKEQLQFIAATFEPPIETALWDLNSAQLNSISDGMLNIPLIYGVTIVDVNKKVLIKKTDNSLSKKDNVDNELSYNFTIKHKFKNNNIFLADVTIHSNKMAIYDRLKVGFSLIIFNAFIKSTALVILFIIAFRKYLATPLESLTKKISTLDWKDKNKRSIDVALQEKNELSTLQNKFNQLLEQISVEEEKQFQLINKHNAQLEEEVKSRTIELEKVNKNLKRLATTDMLTQLNNRSKIDELLHTKHDSYLRYKKVFSIIMLDIDFFKSVNDEYGHLVGDYLLKAISSILKDHIRSSDVIGRWGGEEFLIVCEDTELDGAYALSEHLRQTIEKFEFDYVKHKTVTFGIAQMQEYVSLDALIKKADDALYEGKQSGRNVSVKASLNA
ncbi:MAG: diguanylate cyclase [Helicobacteraceae bacterium]|nr:diguanylate cyclase [Helicobacteraceae bacterium]